MNKLFGWIKNNFLDIIAVILYFGLILIFIFYPNYKEENYEIAILIFIASISFGYYIIANRRNKK